MKSKSSFQYQDQKDPMKGKGGKPGEMRMGAAMKGAKMPMHKPKKK